MYTVLSLSFLHTHSHSKRHMRVCACKHLPPQQKQSGVIKTVSLAAPSQFLFEVAGSERRCPSVPHAFLPSPPPPPPPPLCLSVTLPDAREGEGGGGFHALLGTGPRKSHSMQNTSVMFCVCMCEWVGGCLGVSRRQQF